MHFNGFILLFYLSLISFSLQGQRNSLHVSGGSLILNTAASISYQHTFINKVNFLFGLEANIGGRSDVVVISNRKGFNYRFNSFSFVSYHHLRKSMFLELNAGLSNVTENNTNNNTKSKYRRFYFSSGLVWRFKNLNLRITVASQELLHFGIGAHF